SSAGSSGRRPKEDGESYLASFKLPFMKESCSRQSGHRYRGGTFFGGNECRCRPRLVVVLNETNQPLLVCRIRTEMKPDAFCVVIHQAVIQPLVVTEVEPLLLKFPFQVPVRLGDEEEIGMCRLNGRDQVGPVLRSRLLTRAGAPRAFDDCVQ